MRNKVLKGITILACLAFVLTTFYIDSEAWCMHDLYWQIPVWLICYGWAALFVAANDVTFAFWRRERKKKERKAA